MRASPLVLQRSQIVATFWLRSARDPPLFPLTDAGRPKDSCPSDQRLIGSLWRSAAAIQMTPCGLVAAFRFAGADDTKAAVPVVRRRTVNSRSLRLRRRGARRIATSMTGIEGIADVARRRPVECLLLTEPTSPIRLFGNLRGPGFRHHKAAVEFEAFPECGSILAHGFLRLRCGGAGTTSCWPTPEAPRVLPVVLRAVACRRLRRAGERRPTR